MPNPYYIYQSILTEPYKGQESAYFDLKNEAWKQNLEENWKDILAELKNNSENQFSTNEVSEFQSEADSWQTIGFMFWSRPHKSKMEAFSKTTALLNEIPNLVGASINRLKAGAEITLHKGETNAIYRCHLGLVVPGDLPDIGFKVNDEDTCWEEGKLLVFCDAHQHTAWNHTNEDRYILLLDVIRPEFVDQKFDVCCTVLSLNTLHLLAERFNMKFLFKLKPKQLELFTKILKPLWYCYLPIHRFIGRNFK